MQIIIFQGNGNNEKEVNNWLIQNKNVEIVNIFYQSTYDFYECYRPPQICNQWIITTVLYKNKGDN